jgi:hypothetical protein
MATQLLLAAGQVSDPVEIGPGTRVIAAGAGHVEWTTSSLIDTQNTSVTWRKWPNGSATGFADTFRRVVVRGVATGQLLVSFDEAKRDEGAEGVYWQEQLVAWALDTDGSVLGLISPTGQVITLSGTEVVEQPPGGGGSSSTADFSWGDDALSWDSDELQWQ